MAWLKGLLLGSAYFVCLWMVSGWGLPSADRSQFYPPGASVRLARQGQSGIYVTGPSKSFHPDEASILGALASMRPAALDFNPHFFNYPSLHIYAVGAGVWLAQRQGWISRARTAEHFQAHPEQAAGLYRAGRAVSAFWAAATLVALVVGSGAGLAAALMLACVPLFLAAGSSLTVDMAAAFFATLAALVGAGIQKPTRWKALGAGILAGLAASAKYPAGLALLPVLWGLLAPGERRRDRFGLLWVCLLGAVLGFLVATPYALLAPVEFWNGLHAELLHSASSQGYQFLDAGPAWKFHYLHTLKSGCGLPLTLFLCGLPGIFLDFSPRRRSLLLFVMAGAALLLSSHLYFARYLLPFLPVLVVLAAEGWALVLERMGPRVASWSPWLFLPVLFAQAGIFLCYVLVMLGPDTRMVAARMVAAWPAGSSIRLLEPPYFTHPPLDVARHPLSVGAITRDTLAALKPDGLVVSEFELRDLARLTARLPHESELARALLRPADSLHVGPDLYLGRQVAAPAQLGPYQRPTRDEPQELVMLHPTIFLWQRR